MAVISAEIFQIPVKKFQIYSYARGSFYSLLKLLRLFDTTVKSLMLNNSHSVVNLRALLFQINLNAIFIIYRELNLKKLKRMRIYMWSLHWMFFFYIWNFCILSEEILSLRTMEIIFWIYLISEVRLVALHSICFSLLQTMRVPRIKFNVELFVNWSEVVK